MKGMAMESEFAKELRSKLANSRKNDWKQNWDFRRFGSLRERPLKARFNAVIKGALEALRLRANNTLTQLAAHDREIQWLYCHLADQESRELLVSLMAYRVLGHRKVKLPLNTQAYWQKLDALDSRAKSDNSITLDFRNWKLNLFDLSEEGYPIKVYARPTGIFAQLLLQQYRCITSDGDIEVVAGDTVIDAGGCYGDTALYFSHRVGTNGRVFSFEFMPNNIKIFEENLSLNSELAGKIEIVPNPLWSSSGQKLYVEGVGPASRVTSTRTDPLSKEVETLCIDELAHRDDIERVHFIKMDIEGAELEALKGAEAVIRRDKPKLAISVYHKLDDFWRIPLWIQSLGLEYCFFLRHFTIHAEETVLFAEVRPS